MLQITNALNIFTVRKKTTKKKLPVTERDKQNLRIGSVFKKKKKSTQRLTLSQGFQI